MCVCERVRVCVCFPIHFFSYLVVVPPTINWNHMTCNAPFVSLNFFLNFFRLVTARQILFYLHPADSNQPFVSLGVGDGGCVFNTLNKSNDQSDNMWNESLQYASSIENFQDSKSSDSLRNFIFRK